MTDLPTRLRERTVTGEMPSAIELEAAAEIEHLTSLTPHEADADTEARHAHRDLLAEKDAEIERLKVMLADAKRDHAAIHRMMELIEDDCKTITGNSVARNNIRYLASQAKDWSERHIDRIKEPRNDRT